MIPTTTHVAHSDETHHNVGRFKGIAVITAPTDISKSASEEVRAILASARITELKWEKLRTADQRKAALQVADWLFGKLSALRADILTWDIQDDRHRLARRDDVENMHRMYHHLFKNVLRRRWPAGSTWKLYPDEQDSIDWERVHDVLDATGNTAQMQAVMGERLTYRLRLKTDFRVVQIVPRRSVDEPLIQVADLLAGMAVFSRHEIDSFRAWTETTMGQRKLFSAESVPFSRGVQEKCLVLSEFRQRCREWALPISLNSTNGLTTRDPRVALNFWHYVPQKQVDKAPTRQACSA